MLPRTLNNWNFFIDGVNFAGIATKMKLPDLEINTEEYRGAAMDAPVNLDMGMKLIDVECTIAEFNPDMLALFGLFRAETMVVFRGALRRQGELAQPCEIRVQGGCKKISRDDPEPGKKSEMTLVFNCNMYTETIAGRVAVDIDILNYKRVIGDVDQLESHRAALGI